MSPDQSRNEKVSEKRGQTLSFENEAELSHIYHIKPLLLIVGTLYLYFKRLFSCYSNFCQHLAVFGIEFTAYTIVILSVFIIPRHKTSMS